jgi:hypothetical protein
MCITDALSVSSVFVLDIESRRSLSALVTDLSPRACTTTTCITIIFLSSYFSYSLYLSISYWSSTSCTPHCPTLHPLLNYRSAWFCFYLLFFNFTCFLHGLLFLYTEDPPKKCRLHPMPSYSQRGK